MKRSELNSIIEDTIKFMEDRGLPLPPFAYWGVPEWKAAGKENEEIVENMPVSGQKKSRGTRG